MYSRRQRSARARRGGAGLIAAAVGSWARAASLRSTERRVAAPREGGAGPDMHRTLVGRRHHHGKETVRIVPAAIKRTKHGLLAKQLSSHDEWGGM